VCFIGLDGCGQPGQLTVGEVLRPSAQESLDAIQRISLAAPAPQGLLLDPATDLIDGLGAEVRSTRGAVAAFPPLRFPGPPPEPGVRLSPHPALHEPVPMIRRSPRAWTTEKGCCRDSGNG